VQWKRLAQWTTNAWATNNHHLHFNSHLSGEPGSFGALWHLLGAPCISHLTYLLTQLLHGFLPPPVPEQNLLGMWNRVSQAVLPVNKPTQCQSTVGNWSTDSSDATSPTGLFLPWATNGLLMEDALRYSLHASYPQQLVLLLLPPHFYLRHGGYVIVVVCLSVCYKLCAKNFKRICTKFHGRLAMGQWRSD